MNPHEILKTHFGYDSFRYGQLELIEDIAARRDVLGIMPTGAGKSICFQVPALLMDGVSIVVSPLISLMKDQVNALNQAGIGAAYINSSLTDRQISKALKNAENGAYRLIYVAPERLLSYEFLHFAMCTKVSMVVVDEAHCVSQWGQDFRPSYTDIPKFIVNLGSQRPVIAAFTATATPRVRTDVIERLALQNPKILTSGFDRPNLRFDVLKPKSKMMEITVFVQERANANTSGIIYCSTRKDVESVCLELQSLGYPATRYHAGLSDAERHKNQDDFLHDRKRIMVATNAFGMGIDKSNVSYVVHYNMPSDVEAYYQEAGRAGRDGAPAECLLLYGGRDYQTNMWLIENGESKAVLDPHDEAQLKERRIKRLNEMDIYCKTTECLRGYILKYFGEDPPKDCDNCANCGGEVEEADITIDAQKIISCVVRMRERFGLNMVIDVLRGNATQRVRQFRLNELKTFGISEKSQEHLTNIANHLIMEGFLHKTAERYPLIKLGARANEALQGATVVMRAAKFKAQQAQVVRKSQTPTYAVNMELFEALKAARAALAKENSLPAFVIFHDSTLIDMCAKLPSNLEEMLQVSGVGQVKAVRYGQAFLDVIADFGGQKLPFLSKEFEPGEIEISEENLTASAVADKINIALIQSDYEKISAVRINNWLLAQGYLEVVEEKRVASEAGEQLGIITENRVSQANLPYKLNLFSSSAQEFIYNNVTKILKG